MVKVQREAEPKSAQPESADKATLDIPPDWDRMGQIADRLLSTRPDRKAMVRVLAPKQKRLKSPVAD